MKAQQERSCGGRGRPPTTHTPRPRVGQLRPLFLESVVLTQHGELRLPGGRSELQPPAMGRGGGGRGFESRGRPRNIVGPSEAVPRAPEGPPRPAWQWVGKMWGCRSTKRDAICSAFL